MPKEEQIARFKERLADFRVLHESCATCRKLEVEFANHLDGEERMCAVHLNMMMKLM